MSQIVKLHVYQLKTDNSSIEVSVDIGNQQRATTDLYLEGKKINANPLVDSFTDKKVGSSNSLSGKQLTINTTVFDINQDNNNITFRYKVKGGAKTLYPASSKITVTEGGIAHFFIRIFFI